MPEISARNRPLILLAAALLAQVLLLAFQIRRNQDVRLLRTWTVAVASPFERAGTWLVSGTSAGWHNYVALRQTRRENQELRRQLDDMKLREAGLQSKVQESERLAKILDFREARAAAPMVVAEVIGGSADSLSSDLLINRGAQDGLRKNMGVITPDGVVGKLINVFPGTAQVLLANDRQSGVGGLLAGSRTHGVARGQGGPLLRMDYVISDESVQPGQKVLTSGDDRIFPKDLPLGTVVSTKPGNPFQTIQLEPSAHLDRLEEVIVLLTQQEIPLKDQPLTELPVNDQSPASPGTVPPDAGAAQSPAQNKSAGADWPLRKPLSVGAKPVQPQQPAAQNSATKPGTHNPGAAAPAKKPASQSPSPAPPAQSGAANSPPPR
jgi:rod shape-determining protein MreC